MKKNKILHVHNVKKIFGVGHAEVKALGGVNLDIHRKEVVLIMGPSGSGKSTLLSICGGIMSPTEGEVLVDGKSITDMEPTKLAELRLKKIGFIFQSFMLLSSLTAKENVQIVAEFAGKKEKEAEERTTQILTRLGLQERMNDIPANLSGGEKQRVSIARAIMNNPDLILADEPTANLDSKIGHEVTNILHEIAEKDNKSVVIVSHDERIKDVADRVLLLEDGLFK